MLRRSLLYAPSDAVPQHVIFLLRKRQHITEEKHMLSKYDHNNKLQHNSPKSQLTPTAGLHPRLPEFWMLLVEISALPGGPVSHLQHFHYDLIPLPPALP